jgi:hypothetical protein
MNPRNPVVGAIDVHFDIAGKNWQDIEHQIVNYLNQTSFPTPNGNGNWVYDLDARPLIESPDRVDLWTVHVHASYVRVRETEPIATEMIY